MADSRIEAVKKYFQDYIDAKDNRPLWVDYLNDSDMNYSIKALGSNRKVAEYVHGNSGLREFLFALASNKITADEANRIDNLIFFEELADWLDDQTESDELPVLPSGYTALSIEAIGEGFLFEQGNDEIGEYQIQCRLEYSKS